MHFIKNFQFAVLGILATCAISSCYYDNLDDLYPGARVEESGCDTLKSISYANDILPLLSNNCGTGNACHNGPASNSGVALASYDGIKAVVDNGKLISAITWDGSASNMPKNGQKLDDCKIAVIKKWVSAGAPNN